MYGSYDPLPVDTMEGRVTGDSIEVKFRDILTLRNNDLKSDNHMTQINIELNIPVYFTSIW